jgi:hypothetical protein
MLAMHTAPVINPPKWQKLSTMGSRPIAKLIMIVSIKETKPQQGRSITPAPTAQ